jgi:GxxExxY protein
VSSEAARGTGDKDTYAIIGAAMEVHRRLGPGFLEAVYQEALQIELREQGIPFEREVDIPIIYRDTQLACAYRADFVCFGDVIVELKALRQIGEVERAQTINYLKATGKRRARLLNFGAPSLQRERFAN